MQHGNIEVELPAARSTRIASSASDAVAPGWPAIVKSASWLRDNRLDSTDRSLNTATGSAVTDKSASAIAATVSDVEESSLLDRFVDWLVP